MLKISELGIFESHRKFKNLTVTPERSTVEFEIEFYITDKGRAFVNGTEYPHRENMLIVAPPGTVRHTEGAFSCFYVHMQADGELINLLKNVPLCSMPADAEIIRRSFEKMIELFHLSDLPSRLALEAEIYLLLKNVCVCAQSEDRSESISVKRTIDFMKENYALNLSLEDIASSVNLSQAYFHRIFRKITGETPRQTLLNIRLSVAKRMLLCTNDSLYCIAEKCGFQSQSYFQYMFKKETGITPASFRRSKFVMPEKD